MIEKKFNKPALIFSAIALILSFTVFSFESIIVSVVAIVLTFRKKETHLVKLPMFLSITSIILDFMMISLFIDTCLSNDGKCGYWFADFIINLLK